MSNLKGFFGDKKANFWQSYPAENVDNRVGFNNNEYCFFRIKVNTNILLN